MGAASIVADGNATFAGATSCAESLKPHRPRNFLRFTPRVVETARGISPDKTAFYLHSLTGESVRTWQDRLQHDRLSGEAVCALIASKDGQAYLDTIAGQSPWWRAIQRQIAAAEEREHKMREALNALQSTSEAEPMAVVPTVARNADRPGTGAARRSPSRT